jgi:hypothetical protein
MESSLLLGVFSPTPILILAVIVLIVVILGKRNRNLTQNSNTDQIESHSTQSPEYSQENSKKSNGIGTAGFVLSLVALFLGWIPFFGFIMWLLGLIFSAVGIFRKPNGLAIAGFVISLIGFIILFLFFGAVFSLALLGH